jgi:hypothetical protein
MNTILGSIKPYTGKDPNLSNAPYCLACITHAGVTLRCSRCKLVSFCSIECQKDHYPKHSKVCRRIAALETRVANEAAKLTNFDDFGYSVTPHNLFETSVGSFWGIFDTRNYMRSRLGLANTIHDEIAWGYETKGAWEVVLNHYQEMLRLSSGDNLGLRLRFPFLLLHLNRDNDAFDFVCYWAARRGNENDGGRDDQQHANNSREGDWIYGRREGSRYLDFFDEPNVNRNLKFMGLGLLMAIATIKMRLVAAHQAQKESTNLFNRTPAGETTLAPVRSVISDMIEEGDESFRDQMNRQHTQLNRLLDVIHERNATVLPALLNPTPLRSQPSPGYYTHGHPSEAYEVVKDACRTWARISGAHQILESRYGKNPSYNCNMQMCH